jgi:hypothetical protein
MNPFLLGFIILYAMGFGATLVALLFMESFGSSMGRAFGWGSKATPSWQLFLYALIWPVFLVGALRR